MKVGSSDNPSNRGVRNASTIALVVALILVFFSSILIVAYFRLAGLGTTATTTSTQTASTTASINYVIFLIVTIIAIIAGIVIVKYEKLKQSIGAIKRRRDAKSSVGSAVDC